MPPYLIMVLAGYATFVGVLGVYWLRQYAGELLAGASAGKKVEPPIADAPRKAA